MVTHTPPKYHCDESRHDGAAGCRILREALWRVRPSLAICGHVHEGRGAERIFWDLDCPNVKFKERATGYWTDPSLGLGSKKQCHIDLSAKSGFPLNGTGSWNNGSDGINLDGSAEASENCLPLRKSMHSLAWTSTTSRSGPSVSGASSDGVPYHSLDNLSPAAQNQKRIPKAEISQTEASQSRGSSETIQLAENQENAPTYTCLKTDIHSATRGQGGYPPSGRCDLEALAGRRGRKETCVINAAIMASSWPYRLKDGRKYNKPIIVDIDLPARNSE